MINSWLQRVSTSCEQTKGNLPKTVLCAKASSLLPGQSERLSQKPFRLARTSGLEPLSTDSGAFLGRSNLTALFACTSFIVKRKRIEPVIKQRRHV
ncbi:hypothetical protein AB184_00840 (plasmid) [Klebsiella oxytoca]|nr:hypothetical protein AB184_00840 [Klebsiella oxytoca]AKL20877.1 hypothetical protein AB181_01605 [Klebsiella oxytoca]APB48221.1 hypothetical protein AGF18_30075 [Klebsiella oxytoca]APM29153.1 hypothetical protein AGH21_00235 [Klebsiella oxytoca]